MRLRLRLGLRLGLGPRMELGMELRLKLRLGLKLGLGLGLGLGPFGFLDVWRACLPVTARNAHVATAKSLGQDCAPPVSYFPRYHRPTYSFPHSHP